MTGTGTARLQIDPAIAERAMLLGAIDFHTVAGLRPAGRQWLASRRAGTVFQLDLGAAERCDSAALALLLDWLRHASGCGSILEIIHLPAGLRAMLPVLGLDALLVPEADGALRLALTGATPVQSAV